MSEPDRIEWRATPEIMEKFAAKQRECYDEPTNEELGITPWFPSGVWIGGACIVVALLVIAWAVV